MSTAKLKSPAAEELTDSQKLFHAVTELRKIRGALSMIGMSLNCMEECEDCGEEAQAAAVLVDALRGSITETLDKAGVRPKREAE